VVKRRKKNSSNLMAENRRLLKRLRDLSSRDSLTGAYNYQYLIERLGIELKHAKKYIFNLSLIMLDIDYFESVNDTYGYRSGDKALREFSDHITKFARENDVVMRYGGATFVILLPDTDKKGAVSLGQRLCENIQKHPFHLKKGKIKLKISIGVTTFPEDGIDSVSGVLEAAGRAVHEAKEAGGNRVAFAERTAKDIKNIPLPKDIKLDDLKMRLKKTGKKLDQTLWDSIYALAKTIEAKDHYTGEHAEKMISIVKGIAKELNLSNKDIVNLERAAVLHDLGKIGISDKILLKKGKLTKKEYAEIKRHPNIGAEIIRSIHFLKEVVPLILHHHERFDGMGYNYGLKGKNIPIGARILAIADVYQALISDRPYRKAFSKKEAIKILLAGAGTQFDPTVVGALLKSQKFKKKIKR